jgi:tetratricopeptide (TPR) repeat protein
MLVPVLGLVQVGLQGWAERYTYLPSVGLGLALVFGLARLGTTRARRNALGGALAAALVALLAVTTRQLGTWRDSRTLFEHALGVEESAVAHVNLGLALEAEREPEAAAGHYARAAALAPGLAGPRVNHARVLLALGRAEEARAELEQALVLEPDLAIAHGGLGWLLAERGEDRQALVHLARAVELAPTDSALANSLAWVQATSANHAAPEQARARAAALVAASGGRQASFLETEAAALARLARFEEAVGLQERALALVPPAHRARLAERLALYRSGRPFVKSP